MEESDEEGNKVKKINNPIIHPPREITTILYFHNLGWAASIAEEYYCTIKKEYQTIITTYWGLVTVSISNDYELRNQAEGPPSNLKMILPKSIIGTD